ncbi:MAG: hypothetical protein A2Y12_05040 [Planctomycetes bacterium GWF2_42_9]|nr:MAG: hypothetical protein A2Y12_05040 [Planctomycetes bacterium GWF2_42_9]
MDLLLLLRNYAGSENKTTTIPKVLPLPPQSPADSDNGIPPQLREEFEELAAKLEYDCGLSRAKAETQAKIEILDLIHSQKRR